MFAIDGGGSATRYPICLMIAACSSSASSRLLCSGQWCCWCRRWCSIFVLTPSPAPHQQRPSFNLNRLATLLVALLHRVSRGSICRRARPAEAGHLVDDAVESARATRNTTSSRRAINSAASRTCVPTSSPPSMRSTNRTRLTVARGGRHLDLLRGHQILLAVNTNIGKRLRVVDALARRRKRRRQRASRLPPAPASAPVGPALRRPVWSSSGRRAGSTMLHNLRGRPRREGSGVGDTRARRGAGRIRRQAPPKLRSTRWHCALRAPVWRPYMPLNSSRWTSAIRCGSAA